MHTFLGPRPGTIWSQGVLDALNVFLGQGAVRPFGEKDWSHSGYRGLCLESEQ